MDSGIGDQVGLKLIDICVESTIESQRGCQGRDHLSDQSIEVSEGRSLNSQVSPADIIDSLIVENYRDILMLEKTMSGQNRVVRFHTSIRDLW